MCKYKFGVTQWGLPGNGWYAMKLTKEAGLDGLQLELGSYERGYPLAQQRIREAYMEDAAKYGIEFPSIVLNDINYNCFIHGKNTPKGEISYNQLHIAIEVAAAMNIGMVMVPLMLDNFPTEEQHYRNAAEALKYCCDEAGEHNIVIASETFVSWEDHKRLLDMVDRPNHGIFFDFQNYQFWGKLDQMEILRQMHPQIVPQIHVKDGNKFLSGSMLGKGTANFYEQIDYLIEKDFSGWLILENYYDLYPIRTENEQDQLAVLIEDLKTLKNALKCS